jgi:hypothetical protein
MGGRSSRGGILGGVGGAIIPEGIKKLNEEIKEALKNCPPDAGG